MAFIQKNLSPIGANSKRGVVSQLLSYRTADPIATVVAAGYFDPIAKIISPGDIISVVIVNNADAPTTQTNFKHVYIVGVNLTLTTSKVTSKAASVI